MRANKEQSVTVAKNNNSIQTDGFIESLKLENHPAKKLKPKLRVQYCAVLEYFVSSCSNNEPYSHARIAQYRDFLLNNNISVSLTDKNRKKVIERLVKMPFKRKLRYWLFCDIALILSNDQSITMARRKLSSYLNNKQAQSIEKLNEILYSSDSIPNVYKYAEELILQFRINRGFIKQDEKRFIVTANMSAGKSTLINALIGKPLARTSQESCTANLCYLYSKPFEDNALHLLTSSLNLNACYEDLIKCEKDKASCIASFFNTLIKPCKRINIIDTPGVNSAINREHGKLTRKALKEDDYNYLIYVFNANQLGTDEEMRHLKFVTDNVPKDKIIFVLNKLDSFNKKDDSIKASIDGVRNDLISLDYENPIICPISAYFALLIKLKQNGEMLTDDENDEFDLYSKKFLKPEYDLSSYYGQSVSESFDKGGLTELAIKCGLYGLENVLYGGK